MHEVAFTIPGAPVAKARARSALIKAKSGKQFISHYTPRSTRNYESIVRLFASQTAFADTGPLARDVPVELVLDFVMPMPQSWSQKKRERMVGMPCITKPDLDNIEKSIKDGCNSVVWVDDCQVWSVVKKKFYGTQPRVDVIVCW